MSELASTRGTLLRRLLVPIVASEVIVSGLAIWMALSFTDVAAKPQLIWIAVVALIVVIAATVATLWVVCRTIGQQVRRLATGAESLANGDLTHRFERGLPGVLQNLSESLNRLAEYQGDRIRQLGLQQSELHGILHAMSTGVVAIGVEGQVVSMNPAAMSMLGIGDVEVRGRQLSDIGIDAGLTACAHDALSGRCQGSTEISIEVDELQHIVVRSEPLYDGQDARVGVVLMLDDVTRLRHLEQVRVEFAANVSHELRTPITSIQGYAELLFEEQDEAERVRYASIVVNNAARLSSIIEDLLSLARLENPARLDVPDQEVVQIHELLDGVVRACSAEANASNVVLEVVCHDHMECMGSKQLLEQAVSNLVVNAVRYGPNDATVVISSKVSRDAMIEISVADQGPGIEPQQRDRIFERFYRIDQGRSREVGGTGLGLAIVKHIAQAHGGGVGVMGRQGQGAVFCLRLPACVKAESPEQDLNAVHPGN
ncbi:MAG: ATP-binding protein [Phycisphaerales bacterium]|nr:ATP-binding protein [Phycisphaerales bacterium]